MTRILITGFEPFDGETVNSSHEAGVRIAAGQLAGARLDYLRLPVERFRAVALAVDAMLRLRPAAIVALGQANGRARITPERIAINVDDFRIPDNAGIHVQNEPHVLDGPAAYLSTLPIRGMVEAMIAAGVPAAISNTAGTFLCNHVAYGLLHAKTTHELDVDIGFIHLPYLPEQAATKRVETASMAVETMLTGLHAALPIIRDHVNHLHSDRGQTNLMEAASL